MNRAMRAGRRMAPAVALAVLLPSCCLQRRADLLSYDEYRRHRYYDPYVLQLDTERAALMYFGAEHSVDPRHPQVALIEKLWDDFKPTIAFSEGGVWTPRTTIEDAVTTSGEAGVVRFLADRDSLPIRSLEPDSREELAEAMKEFTAQQIKLYYVLRQIAQYNRMNLTDSLDALATECMMSFSRLPGLGTAPPNTLEELERLTEASLPAMGGWRKATTRWFSPVGSLGWTNDVAAAVSRLRDKHMVSLLTREVLAGERVFAVVGFSHVVMQEPALRANLKE